MSLEEFALVIGKIYEKTFPPKVCGFPVEREALEPGSCSLCGDPPLDCMARNSVMPYGFNFHF